MFSLAWPWALIVLPLPALLRGLLPASTNNRTVLRIPFFQPLHSLSSRQPRRIHLASSANGVLVALVWLLLVMAAARPQWHSPQRSLAADGRNSMLAVDLSASMQTRDLQQLDASRFEITRTLVQRLLNNRPDDRFGLIFFGSQAFLQAPLTFDHASLQHWLHSAAPGLAGDNTAIGDAIGLAIKRLRELPARDKNLILLTDGANNSGIMPPRTAARFAAREGIRIHTLGIGQAAIASQQGPDQILLQDLAWLTGGRYLHVDSQAALQRALDFFDSLPSQPQQRVHPHRQELYHWPLRAALVLILTALVIRLLQGLTTQGRQR